MFKGLYILVLVVFPSILSCKAQNPVISLYNGSDFFETQNAYYKDLAGDFTRLEGTWKYTNGIELFEIILLKKEQELYDKPDEISYYEDLMYGEYRYINALGTEIVNSINNIDSYGDVSEHFIFGGYIMGKYHLPICNDCNENERRVKLMVEDPLRPYFYYDMTIRHFPNDPFGEPEHIVLIIRLSDSAIVPEGASEEDRLPTYRELTLYKQ